MYHTHHITITADVTAGDTKASRALIRKTIHAALREEGVATPCEIDVLLTDDAGIRRINREMRHVDRATDVLSFPMFTYRPGCPPVTAEDADVATGLTPLGDMVISLERVAAQATEYGHSRRRELSYLVVHSTLHLLGYDHLDEGTQKRQMRVREEAVLAAMDAESEERRL